MPAVTPIKKKQIVNSGLVSNQLSKRNPIVDPTNTAATNSVLIFKALPKDAAFELRLFFSKFLVFFFSISRRVEIYLKTFIIYLIIYATNSSAFCKSTETSWLIPFSGIVTPYNLSILDIVKAW